MVEMGPDRMHHGFWKDMDPEHRKHVAGGPYEDAILDYHRHVDGLIGAPARARRRGHGRARRLRPRREADGRRHPRQRVAAARGPARDAARARASAHVARRRRHRLVADDRLGRRRLLLARLPQRARARAARASIAPEDYERVRADLARRLEAIPDEHGQPDRDRRSTSRTRSTREVNGVAPDLIVHFGDLLWRSVGTVGGDEGIHTFENDTGPGRREPRAGRPARPRRARRRARRGARACTCSTSPRPCSSCSASTRPRRCAAAACSRRSPPILREPLARRHEGARGARHVTAEPSWYSVEARAHISSRSATRSSLLGRST